MLYIHKIQSPVGRLTLSSDGESLTGLWIEGQKHYASTLDPSLLEGSGTGAVRLKEKWEEKEGVKAGGDLPVFDHGIRWLEAYFKGQEPGELPRLSPVGSEFRQMVWKVLLEVPRGHTTTYGKIGQEVAERTGRRSMSAQAVGGAVGHNPISIMIPCHRVLGAEGGLIGYAAGVGVKKMLLEIEGEVGKGL